MALLEVDEQERMHITLMTEALGIAGFNKRRSDAIHYIMGTPTHDGPRGAYEL